MLVFAIIPARSGSQSIKNKNIKPIFGKPLLSYSIELAKKSKLIDEVYVSSDSKKILNIAKRFGAETILRPKNISKNYSLDYEYLKHFINTNKLKENYIIIILRPTSPFRSLKLLNDAILKFSNSNADSLRSVSMAEQSPYKMWFKNKNNLEPFMGKINIKYTNYPRQKLKKIYWQNGYIDITTHKTLQKYKNELGPKIKFYEIKHKVIEIDYKYQLNDARKNATKINISKVFPS